MPSIQLNLGGIEKMIVGMTEAQAMRTLMINGLSGRVIERDGKSVFSTADYDPNCLDLVVAGGKVVSAK